MAYIFPDRDGPDSPWPVFERVLRSHDELTELADLVDQDVTVAFLLQVGDMAMGGRSVLGFCCMPSVQGILRPLFDQLLEDALGYLPDFLIVLSADWWETASAREREILVVHEALHAGQALDEYGTPKFNRKTGAPMLRIVPHDVEEFNSIVRRYGPWKGDLADFIRAAGEFSPESQLANSSQGVGRLTRRTPEPDVF